MNGLFSQPEKLHLPDSDITYFPNFLTGTEADHYFTTLLTTVPWQQDLITVFGKTHPQPRLTALYGNNDKPYSYANITMHPNSFTPLLLALKDKVDTVAGICFTSCLLNLYRTGKDSNGWHADNEKELGLHPVIASISLGEERYFHLKHKTKTAHKHKIRLQHGSLLLMKGETQQHWLHQIPKTTKAIKERINLTFRVIN
ncbi:alpha-ketoglutarate-dependent dioxygenase AlkB [Arenibacter sp. 6A1]|uniref:alpha-ketoglutarate-dependent dioxygenase AlkB family protein n=1 Tax=Arenibacter sp. 6A1 TaxID=2720391 RepID=UPI001446561B|nr:alpha-ketoglutarate-dependent dioxygenase AlkB [Arenibacter sp. 6A1]NKI27763.1 alpha-ketoglutarate-dependent dioxygenase AlkB [Arenibacter sp. 6A1]